METGVLGLIPGGDWNFSFSLLTDFPLQFPRHAPGTSGFFFSNCPCLFLYSLLVSYLTPYFPLLPLDFLCKAVQSQQMFSVLCSPFCVLFSVLCLYFLPALSLLGLSHQSKTDAACLQWRQEKDKNVASGQIRMQPFLVKTRQKNTSLLKVHQVALI